MVPLLEELFFGRKFVSGNLFDERDRKNPDLKVCVSGHLFDERDIKTPDLGVIKSNRC